ncbi:MAG: chemotaxis protein CheR [Treponema sp.]|nr:chemotaxis protein CheR [Treponema sp.]
MGSEVVKQITELTDEQFHKIADFIQTNVGIKMPDQKKIMVQSRLQARLKALNIDNFDEYMKYAFSGGAASDEEIALMIDVITTNLTSFFRENQHFVAMQERILPDFAKRGCGKIELWSAACSSGQEPYTLSIVMSEFIRTHQNGPINDFSILATDISSRVLDRAVNAVYSMDDVEDLEFDLKKRYFLKSKNAEERKVRIKPELRRKVQFERLNFMDNSYPIQSMKHIIFCRNALIYFDKPTQEAVIRKLIEWLVPGGYLFLGHSETIFGLNLPLETVGPTIFQKVSDS